MIHARWERPGPARLRARVVPWAAVLGVLAVATALWMARRPDELAAPYLWDEEFFVARSWAEQGWTAAVTPVQGQLVLWTSANLVLSAAVSWLAMPTVNYVMAVATWVLTATLLLARPSRYGGLATRSAMVLSLALVPVNPETYGVMLYSFWWLALWPVIVLGWTGSSARERRIRWVVLAVAGLGSLAAAALVVVYAGRWFLDRSRDSLVCAAILAGALVVQAWAFLFTHRTGEVVLKPVDTLEQGVMDAGTFVLRPLLAERQPGVLTATLVGLALWVLLVALSMSLRPRPTRLAALQLVACAGVFSVLSSVPAPLISDPVLKGPRYFFLPFAALGLLLVLLVAQVRHRPAVAACAAVLLLGAAAGVPETFVRHSQHLDWRAEVVRCAAAERPHHLFTIQFDGVRANVWRQPLDPEVCRAALGG